MRARWALVVVGLMVIALLVRLALERGRTPTFVEPTGEVSELVATPVATTEVSTERMEFAQEPAPVAPPLDEHVTTLRVEDELGAAIAGVELWLADDLGVERLGASDELGTLAVSTDVLRDRELWAKAREHETRSWRVASEPAESIVLVLPSAVALRGNVRHHGAPKAGLRVVAWPSGRGPECELLRTASPDDPRLLRGVSAADGSFEVIGTARGVDYHVIAAGEGLVTQRKAVARAGTETELEVVELYGVRLVVGEVGGGPLNVSNAWFDSYAEQYLDLDDRAALVDGAEALCLLGLESPPFVEDRFDFAYLSTRSDGAKVAGPLLVEHRLTGYRPSKRRVDLPRVVTALATKRIELEPNGAELGALTIEFRGARAELALGDAQGNYLELVDPHDAKHRLVLAHTHGAQRFDRLPAGHYRWRFHGADGLWRSPSEDTMPELTIDASAPLVSIDWGDAGALDVTTGSHGDAQRGTLWVSCVGRRGMHSFAFADGRVRLVGLSPGDYELALCRPGEPHRPDLAKYGARATVRAGEATTSELAPR